MQLKTSSLLGMYMTRESKYAGGASPSVSSAMRLLNATEQMLAEIEQSFCILFPNHASDFSDWSLRRTSEISSDWTYAITEDCISLHRASAAVCMASIIRLSNGLLNFALFTQVWKWHPSSRMMTGA